MPDEPVSTEIEVVESAPAEEQRPDLPEGAVDTAPDPAELKAEIERLEAARKKAEEDARYWRQEKARSRAEYFKTRGEEEKPPETKSQLPAEIGQAPRQEDFDDYEKYLRARDEYTDKKIAYEVTKARSQWEADEERKRTETAYQTKRREFQYKIDVLGPEKYADFDEVAKDQMVPITPMVIDAMMEFEKPEELAYYLGKNRTEAIQISRMTPLAAARALARIELEIEKAGPVPATGAKRSTGAPPPIRPTGAGNVVNKDPDKMTQKEYEEWRKTQGAHRY